MTCRKALCNTGKWLCLHPLGDGDGDGLGDGGKGLGEGDGDGLGGCGDGDGDRGTAGDGLGCAGDTIALSSCTVLPHSLKGP
jgi:hypothetical protein